MSKMKNTIITAVYIILILIIVYCLVYIANYYINSNKDKELYHRIDEDVVITNVSTNNANETETIYIDMDKLMSLYSGASGYIYQEDFISLPIMQTLDNDYYLEHDAAGNDSIGGALFFDVANTTKSRRLIVYGHNMKNGTMFGNLDKYKDEDYAKKHKDFYLTIKDNTYTATVICASYTTGGSYMYDTESVSDEEFNAWINKIKAGAIISLDTKVSSNDGTILLSTCTEGNGRFILLLKVNDLNSYIKSIKNERTLYLYE